MAYKEPLNEAHPLNRPVLSVWVVTYNHEKFIAQALDGILRQKTDFTYEVVVGEDCSTDGTRAILKRYELAHPDKFVVFYHEKNVGAKRNAYEFTLPACSGKYIACLEGDDYWTDPNKLQRQVDFLESNPDYGMVAENALVKNLINNTEYQFSDQADGDLGLEDLLGKRPFPTASVVFRSALIDQKLLDFENLGDTILWCYLATKGKIRYTNLRSSIYTRSQNGMVASSDRLHWARLMEQWNAQIAKLLTDSTYRSIFDRRNYDEYAKAMQAAIDNGNYGNARLAFFKCLKYKPLSAFKKAVKSVWSNSAQKKT